MHNLRIPSAPQLRVLLYRTRVRRFNVADDRQTTAHDSYDRALSVRSRAINPHGGTQQPSDIPLDGFFVPMKHRTHHPTLDHEKAGRIEFGDVSAWSRATTHAVRPKVKGRHLTFSPPVTDLAKVKPIVSSVTYPTAPAGFVTPVETERKPADCDMQRTHEICTFFDNLYAKLGRT